jgi:ATP:ADP antiporter, AAA family
MLNLRSGDLAPGLLLFFYLFFAVSASVVGKIARDALFLDRFRAVQLPYADIAVAVIVGIVVAGWAHVGRRVGLYAMLQGTALICAATSLVFWFLARASHPIWLYPVVYLWVGIFGVLVPMQVWMLGNCMLTTREAKRIFGLVGAGAIMGWIFAGIFSKVVAESAGAESLLLAMAALLALCAIPIVLCRRSRASASQADTSADRTVPQMLSLRRSLLMIYSSRYLRVIAILICLSSFTTTVAGWQFKAMAKEVLTQRDALAAFFGDFNLYAGIFALLLQVALTSRLLRRFGIGPALLLAPLALIVTSVGVITWGTLLSVVLLRGGDQVLRYAVDKPSVELLYLPIAANVKVHAKSLIDAVIWRFGDGLGGASLLLFATYLQVPASRMSWIILALAPAWAIAAVYCQRLYVATLRDVIGHHQLATVAHFTAVLDRDATAEIMQSNLSARDPLDVLYSMSLFDLEKRPNIHALLRDRLKFPDPVVRRKAIEMLRESRDPMAAQWVEPLLHDSSLEVRVEALRYLAECSFVDPLARIEQLGDFPDVYIRAAVVAFLAHPGESQNLTTSCEILNRMVHDTGPAGRMSRLEAARLLAILPASSGEQIGVLLSDSDHDVAREAIRTVAKLRQTRFLSQLVERLGERPLVGDIQTAVAGFGESVIPLLREYLRDAAHPLALRRRIPPILVRIGTQSAADVLLENLSQRDPQVRTRILAGLREIAKIHAAVRLAPSVLDATLAEEIAGQYRCYQVLEVLKVPRPGLAGARQLLQEGIQHQWERIFALLTLRYPQPGLLSAYFGLQSHDATVRDNALEFLDNILEPGLARRLVPLLDARSNAAMHTQLAATIMDNRLDLEPAVAFLLTSRDPWLRRSGIGAMMACELHSLGRLLDSCVTDQDSKVREAARQASTFLHSDRLKGAGNV